MDEIFMTATIRKHVVRSLFALGLLNSTAAFCFGAVWDNWLDAIRNDLGYSVVQGGAHVFNLSDCATSTKVFGSCGGNNPAAPYIEIQPPESNGADNEFVDPCYTTNTSGCLPEGSTVNAFTATGPAGNNVNQYYRLGDQDALVVIVSLPPNAAYLGYQSYVFSRSVTQYSTAPVRCNPTAGVDLCRAPVLGSLGNSINNIALRIQSPSLALPSPSATTAPEVVFISTANDTLYTNLRNTFMSAGGSSSQIFVERFYRRNKDSEKPPLLKDASYSPFNVITGFDTSTISAQRATSDEFNTLIRYSVFEDSTASKRWLCAIDKNSASTTPDCQNITTPLSASPIAVYRITKKASVLDSLSPGKSKLTTRSANNDESRLLGVNYKTVALDLADAIDTYMAKTQNGTRKMAVKQMNTASNVGPKCITYDKSCYEDTQDTAPYGTADAGELNDDSGSIAFIVGVNHANATVNNATYLSVGVYDAGSLKPQDFNVGLLEGVASFTQTNAQATGFDSCANASTDPTKSNCLNGSATQVWKDIGQPPGNRKSLTAATVANLYVATVARDTYCASGGAGAALPFCSDAYIKAGYTILPITPAGDVDDTNCDPTADPHCGKYLPIDDVVGLSERAYVVPGHTNGADPHNIIYPFVVH